jgi:hypothetical protein
MIEIFYKFINVSLTYKLSRDPASNVRAKNRGR